MNYDSGYPKEMVHKDTGVIVLFESEGVGGVIDPGNSSYCAGEHYTHWDMDEFVLMGE